MFGAFFIQARYLGFLGEAQRGLVRGLPRWAFWLWLAIVSASVITGLVLSSVYGR
jgi:hypothetical protein